MRRLLVTGGSGLMGGNLALEARSRFEVLATYRTHEISIEGVQFFCQDITERDVFLRTVQEIHPYGIIHCAALTDVDRCEQQSIEARRQNVAASRNVADAANEVGAYLVHISTDSVFDGDRGCYTEEDPVEPLNVYARTKVEAEREVLGRCRSVCVVRTNIYGWNAQDKLSLAEWFLDRLGSGQRVSGFDDVYFTPLLVNNLAGAVMELLSNRINGIYHIAGCERVSKYEFGLRVAHAFELDTSLIQPASVANHNFFAQRPRDTSLDTTRAQCTLETELLDVDAGLRLFRRLREDGYVWRLKGHGDAGD